MTEWKVKDLTYLMFFGLSEPPYTVSEFFLDVDKMPIAKRLLEWGIDAGEIPLTLNIPRGAVMAAYGSGELAVRPASLAEHYPTDADKYIVLSHELAHFLQYVEGRMDVERFSAKPPKLHEWSSLKEEVDAVRWGALQAKVMGMSKTEFDRLGRTSLPKEAYLMARQASLMIYSGKFPEEHGVQTMFRRPPVRVRQHRRRR